MPNSMIFALADERTRQGFSHVKPVAETVLAKVQEFAKRESHALTGLATGFRDLDQMTSGLQTDRFDYCCRRVRQWANVFGIAKV